MTLLPGNNPPRPTLTSLQQQHHHHRSIHRYTLTGSRLATFVVFVVALSGVLLFETSRVSVQQAEQASASRLRDPSKTQQNAESEFPIWRGWESDRVNPDKYGYVTLTGSYQFPLTDEGANAILHFPTLDLKGSIDSDEAKEAFLKVTRGTLPEKLREDQISLTRPLYTQRLKTSPADSYALLTRCGFKTAASPTTTMNQDRLFLLTLAEDEWIMALLDGHGAEGHVVSHFAALELPRRLPQRLKDASNNVEQAFTSAFLEVEREIPPEARHSGSTAIALYRKGDQLYVANTGDSLAIVVAYDPLEDRVNIVYETKPHKPALPEERKRIESLGGQVLLPEQMSEKDTSSRVIVPLEGQFMALAMSRSIGDKEATELGVIANPTVDTLNLKKWEGEKLFAIAASDGLWDHVKPIDVAKHLATSLYKKSEGVFSPLEACEQLIMQSSRRWIAEGIPYRDDISIAVSKII